MRIHEGARFARGMKKLSPSEERKLITKGDTVERCGPSVGTVPLAGGPLSLAALRLR